MAAHASFICLLAAFVCVAQPRGSFAQEQGPVRHAPQKHGRVHFNNPKLLSDLVKNDDAEYTISNLEEKANPRQMGGIVIDDEASVLGSKLTVLSNIEIGATTMQASCK